MVAFKMLTPEWHLVCEKASEAGRHPHDGQKLPNDGMDRKQKENLPLSHIDYAKKSLINVLRME